MDAVILAGGLGTRLRDAVSDRPKPMADINGRPFILYLFDQLIEIGLPRAIVATGYLNEYFPRTLGTRYRGLEICYSEEEVRLGTGGALKVAAKQLKSENVLVMNGDSYLEVDFADFFSCHCRCQSEITMALTIANDQSPFGRVEMDTNGRITSFEEKRSSRGSASWVNGGRYLFRKETIKSIPVTYPFSLEIDLFPKLTGRNFYGYKTSGLFIDIGTPLALENAQSLLGSAHN